jgi:hypothetical protein
MYETARCIKPAQGRAAALKGKNVLERFAGKCGCDQIWTALTHGCQTAGEEFGIDGKDIALDDIGIKTSRNLLATGAALPMAVLEAYVAYTDLCRNSQAKSQWFAVSCAAEVDSAQNHLRNEP